MDFTMTSVQEAKYDKWEKDQNARLETNKKYQPSQEILNFMGDTQQIIDYVKEKSTAVQRIKDIKFLHYPLDPINHIIWSMKTAGATVRRPALAKTENPPKAFISLGLAKEFKLTGIHKRIMIAIGALWDARITEDIPVLDIWRMIGYKSNTSGGRDKNLVQIIQDMAKAKCAFNNNEEVDRGMASKHAQYSGPLIHVVCDGMKVTILEKPALLCFAEERNEYAVIPAGIFGTDIRLTAKTATMENYIIERIYGKIRKDAQSITFKSLWENAGNLQPLQEGWETNWNDEKTEYQQYLCRALNYYQALGIIPGYVLERENGMSAKVKICDTGGQKMPMPEIPEKKTYRAGKMTNEQIIEALIATKGDSGTAAMRWMKKHYGIEVTRNAIPWRIKRDPELAKTQSEIAAGVKSWSKEDNEFIRGKEAETKMEWKETDEKEYRLVLPDDLALFIKYQAESIGIRPADMAVKILERHKKQSMEKLKEIW